MPAAIEVLEERAVTGQGNLRAFAKVGQSLPDLAQAIDREHQAAHQAARTALEHAFECGRLLLEAKAAVPHGEWLPWLEANCTVKRRTAQLYMRLATELPKLSDEDAQRVAHLTVREAVDLVSGRTASIAALPPPDQARLIERVETKGERIATAEHHVRRASALADLAAAAAPARPAHAGADRRKRLLRNTNERRLMLVVGPNAAGAHLDRHMRALKDGEQYRARQSEIDELTREADDLERRAAKLRKRAEQYRHELDEWTASALVERHGPIRPFIETATYSVDEETFAELSRLPEQEAIAVLLDRSLLPLTRGYWGNIQYFREFGWPQPATEWTNIGNEHGLPPEVVASILPNGDAAP